MADSAGPMKLQTHTFLASDAARFINRADMQLTGARSNSRCSREHQPGNVATARHAFAIDERRYSNCVS
jgi:hypothetical protein